LKVIHSEVARLEKTTQGFLDLARLPDPQRANCDVRKPISEALELLRPRAEQQNVTVVSHSPLEPVVAYLDCDQIRTVLVNLGINALDAMPNGGTFEISLIRTLEHVVVRICDTGPGFAPEIIDRLFTPFASTKPTGTGLGLSICRRILQEHGGKIIASSRPGGGACFNIELPFDQAAAGEMIILEPISQSRGDAWSSGARRQGTVSTT
jgi:signal transduction histidine kinase